MFKTLAEWRVAMTPLVGPLFSDALRALKKAIKRASKATKGGGQGPAKKQKTK